MSSSKIYSVTIDHVMQERTGAYCVTGTVKLDVNNPNGNNSERSFVLCCEGIENSKMIKPYLEFSRISDSMPINQPYMKYMFKEICDACYISILDYMDTDVSKYYSWGYMSKFRFILSWVNSLGMTMARVIYIDKDKYYVLVCSCKGKSNGKLVGLRFSVISSVYKGSDIPYNKELFEELESILYTNIGNLVPELQNTAWFSIKNMISCIRNTDMI